MKLNLLVQLRNKCWRHWRPTPLKSVRAIDTGRHWTDVRNRMAGERKRNATRGKKQTNKHYIREDSGWFIIQENPLVSMRKDSGYSPWQPRTSATRTRAALYPTNLLSLLISFFSFSCWYRTNPGLWPSWKLKLRGRFGRGWERPDPAGWYNNFIAQHFSAASAWCAPPFNFFFLSFFFIQPLIGASSVHKEPKTVPCPFSR